MCMALPCTKKEPPPQRCWACEVIPRADSLPSFLEGPSGGPKEWGS